MFRTLFARLLKVLGVILLAALAFATPASAAPTVHVVTPDGVAVAFTLDPAAVVQLVVAFILPVIVGLVTTRVTSAATKAWLLAALALVTSLLVELGRSIAAGTTFDVGIVLIASLPTFVISVATHYGLWKPTGVSLAAQNVGARHLAD